MNFSRGLQAELVDTNVRLQLVLPASTATELLDLSGVPLPSLNQANVMTAENLVDAALGGHDKGELITLPSVLDAGLWDKFDDARTTLFAATQKGTRGSLLARASFLGRRKKAQLSQLIMVGADVCIRMSGQGLTNVTMRRSWTC